MFKGGMNMNREMKLLTKKLTALFLSAALVVGLVPANVEAQTTNEFSFEILDCVDTYYEGFNDNVAVAVHGVAKSALTLRVLPVVPNCL